MVASGVAAGVVSDATVRDEDAVSGISNGYKYRLIKLLRVLLHSCKSPISGSTRNEQFHMKKSMKNTQCECSDDLALVWLVLEHLARLKQTVVGLNVLPPTNGFCGHIHLTSTQFVEALGGTTCSVLYLRLLDVYNLIKVYTQLKQNEY